MLSRQLKTKHKLTKNIIDLNINQINVSTLPQIFIRFRGQKNDDLQVALADSGSQGNIIAMVTVLKLGFDKNKIQKCESFNIKSSTETVENAIEGKVQLDLLFLLQSKGSHSNFGKATVQFLVAGEKVTMGRLILGVPFMDDNQVKMNFGHQGCSIKAFLQTENDYEMVKLQTLGQKTLQVSNIDRIQPGDKVANFELNSFTRFTS